MIIEAFLSNVSEKDLQIPGMGNGNKPPCTETGLLGSEKHLIPETMFPNTEITDGAIFKIDFSGNETIVAAWNEDMEKFVTIK